MEQKYIDYENLYNSKLIKVADDLEVFLSDVLSEIPHVDRVSARAKLPKSFIKKAANKVNGNLKYDDPFKQIQDQIGARVITFYLHDVDYLSAYLKEYFRPLEEQIVVPESVSEFGYFGKHFIFLLPEDVVTNPAELGIPSFFELQIKTLFQHAWSEANHDLCYKPNAEVTNDFKRKIAFTSAQAWGADQIFNELSDVVSIEGKKS